MPVRLAYASVCTVEETLANNPESSPVLKRKVKHSAFDTIEVLDGASTPPASAVAAFELALVDGAATIDLTNLTGTNGKTLDGTGLRVQAMKIRSKASNGTGAGSLTVSGTGIVPDCTGTYRPNGTNYGFPTFEREDGAYWIWNSGYFWYISLAVDNDLNSWSSSPLEGEYEEHDTYSGNPVVTNHLNGIHIAKGVSNGYDGFGADFAVELIPSGEAVFLTGDAGGVIGPANKLLSLTGNGTRVLEILLVLG